MRKTMEQYRKDAINALIQHVQGKNVDNLKDVFAGVFDKTVAAIIKESIDDRDQMDDVDSDISNTVSSAVMEDADIAAEEFQYFVTKKFSDEYNLSAETTDEFLTRDDKAEGVIGVTVNLDYDQDNFSSDIIQFKVRVEDYTSFPGDSSVGYEGDEDFNIVIEYHDAVRLVDNEFQEMSEEEKQPLATLASLLIKAHETKTLEDIQAAKDQLEQLG